MVERGFEDLLSKYPELIEPGLTFKGRQVKVGRNIVDLLFEDKHGYKLIVEVKKGCILQEHLAQILAYEGYFLSSDNPKVRTMLIGNRVPVNLRRAFDHHGFEWKELPVATLIEFVQAKNDQESLRLFSEEEFTPDVTAEKQKRKPIPSQTRLGSNTRSNSRKARGLPSLQSATTLEELKEVINLRYQQVPTNYMDKLLMENRHRRLSALLKDFNAYDPNYQHFSSVASIKDHIRYRERMRGWIFEWSDDPDDPVVVLVGLKNSKR